MQALWRTSDSASSSTQPKTAHLAAIFRPARLCRLDYRLAAWRLEDVEPFHVEIGYWYWDAEHELVMRGLLPPRGTSVLAGGTPRPDDTIIKVAAASESDTFGILSNPCLLATARTTS